ncbi:MAG: DNA polymerase III subunit delta [Ruminococcaceae bacterium]|nr:DNA polymerase III subunit delta [Oscillospiraceae bacterium]
MVEKGVYTIQKMNQLLADGNLSGVYLFHGPEEYFKDFYCNKIKEKSVGEDVLNYTKYTTKTDPVDIIEICNGYPMFADFKMVVVCESEYFTGKNENEDLIKFVSSVPETTILVFRESKVDKRSKLYKAIESYGVVFNCERQKPEMITKLLAKVAKSKKRGITQEAAQLMIMGIGSDMERLLSELEKLVLLTAQDEVINEEHVRETCALSLGSKIWDLTDAIASGNKEKAFVYLKALLDAREPAEMILFSITKNFINLYNAKSLHDQGKNYSQIASIMGSPEFVARKACQQASRLSLKTLSDKIEYCLDMDERSKTGRINTVRALELIVSL